MVLERSSDVLTGVSFEKLKLSPDVYEGLTTLGFTALSPVQLQSTPLALSGKDVVIQAKSGTGKTLVFTIVALETVCVSEPKTQVLIIAPTREIAVQVAHVISSAGSRLQGLRVHSFIGGTNLHEDKKHAKGCHVAVGTPGRLYQLLDMGILNLSDLALFVLDEADNLMHEGFRETIENMMDIIPATAQIMAMSATYPSEMEEHILKRMTNPEVIRVNVDSLELVGIEQYVQVFPETDFAAKLQKMKHESLLKLLENVEFTQCMVFTNYQTRAESIASHLTSKGWPARSLSAHMDQTSRLQTLACLQQMKCRIVVCTDLAARGIDAENVDLVVNVDVAIDPSTYLHRIGRAGRFGGHGFAISFAAEGEELEQIRSVVTTVNVKIRKLTPEILESFSDEEERANMELLEGNGKITLNVDYSKRREEMRDRYKGKKRTKRAGGWETPVEAETEELVGEKQDSSSVLTKGSHYVESDSGDGCSSPDANTLGQSTFTNGHALETRNGDIQLNPEGENGPRDESHNIGKVFEKHLEVIGVLVNSVKEAVADCMHEVLHDDLPSSQNINVSENCTTDQFVTESDLEEESVSAHALKQDVETDLIKKKIEPDSAGTSAHIRNENTYLELAEDQAGVSENIQREVQKYQMSDFKEATMTATLTQGQSFEPSRYLEDHMETEHAEEEKRQVVSENEEEVEEHTNREIQGANRVVPGRQEEMTKAEGVAVPVNSADTGAVTVLECAVPQDEKVPAICSQHKQSEVTVIPAGLHLSSILSEITAQSREDSVDVIAVVSDVTRENTSTEHVIEKATGLEFPSSTILPEIAPKGSVSVVTDQHHVVELVSEAVIPTSLSAVASELVTFSESTADHVAPPVARQDKTGEARVEVTAVSDVGIPTGGEAAPCTAAEKDAIDASAEGAKECPDLPSVSLNESSHSKPEHRSFMDRLSRLTKRHRQSLDHPGTFDYRGSRRSYDVTPGLDESTRSDKANTLETSTVSEKSKRRSFRPLKFARKALLRTRSLIIPTKNKTLDKSGPEPLTPLEGAGPSEEHGSVSPSLEISPVTTISRSPRPNRLPEHDTACIELCEKLEETRQKHSKGEGSTEILGSGKPVVAMDAVDGVASNTLEPVVERVKATTKDLLHRTLSDETLKKQTLIVTDSEHDLPGGLERKCIEGQNLASAENLAVLNPTDDVAASLADRGTNTQSPADHIDDNSTLDEVNQTVIDEYQRANNLWYAKYYEQANIVSQYVENCRYVRQYQNQSEDY